MRIDDRIVVTAQWSSFFHEQGTVTQLSPHLMILIDGYTHPMRFGEREVAELPRPEPHFAGAE